MERAPTGSIRIVIGGEGPIRVNLEPEGNEVVVPEGDWLSISIPQPYEGDIEIGHHPDGISILRPHGPCPTVTRRNGTEIPW